jgi:hypothetical protein
MDSDTSAAQAREASGATPREVLRHRIANGAIDKDALTLSIRCVPGTLHGMISKRVDST